MKSINKQLALALGFMCGCMFLAIFTSPSIESMISIFSFFLFFYLCIYYFSVFIMNFLDFKNNIRVRAVLFAAASLVLLLLATFKALRVVEFTLLVLTFSISTWYFAKKN